MRVLIADEFSQSHLDAFRALGLTVDYQPKLKADDLPVHAATASLLVVRSTEVKRAVFQAAPALSLVIRAGAGTNTIDVAAASERGVYVANCPGRNAVAVAELTLGLILAIDRRIPDNVADLRAGHWKKSTYSRAQGLSGKCLGIVGFGAIGAAVASRAKAFGMRVVAHSRSLTTAQAHGAGIERGESVLAVAAQADFLSLHTPGSAETKGLVSREVLRSMRDGAAFINTARADVVDNVALLEELSSGRLFAGLDVFPDEPKGGETEWTSALTGLPNVYGTHHIGASTEQAQTAIADETVRIVEHFLSAGEVRNCVNVASKTPARFALIVRHFDKVGVLANVLGELREAGINAQELENTVFAGATAACCKVQLDHRPSEEVLARIRQRTDEVIFVDMVELKA